MKNESDCRFRRIATDMSDFEDTLEELLNGVTDDGQPLSDDELRAARRVIACCLNVVNLVADSASAPVDLEHVEHSVEALLRSANSVPLQARYDVRDLRVLVASATR